MTHEERQIVANEAEQLSKIVSYSYDEYIEFMKMLLKQHPFSYFSIAKGKRFFKLWSDICEKTKFLNDYFSPDAATRIFYYINKIDDIKRCETCNDIITRQLHPTADILHFFCCNRCAQKHESTVAKTKSTKLKNHGDPNWNNMEKNKATCKERYGVEYSFQAKEVKEKARQSIKDRFGVDHQMKSQEVRDGMRSRYKAKHGVDYSWQDPDVKDKIRRSKVEKKNNELKSVCQSAEVIIYSKDVLRQKVIDIIERFPNSFSRIIKSKNHDMSILASLNHYCPKVANDEYTVQTKLYWFLNDISEFPKCGNDTCSNTFEHKNVINWKLGYHKNCCSQCAKDSEERKRLYVESCKEKYGVENASQAEEVKEKKAQSAIDKYGVDNVAKDPRVQKSIQDTNIERYGATLYMNSLEGSAAIRQQCLDKYGVEHYSQTNEYIEKCKATNQANYGVDWPQKNREFMRNMQKRYAYEGMNFDSKPELAYYIWLKDHNADFAYQPDVSYEYEHNGVIHIYEPDFIVEGQAVEIKGDHFFKEDGTMQNPFDHSQDALYEAKHQCMLLNEVKIMKSDEYEFYVAYVEQKYGKDYLKSFKNF